MKIFLVVILTISIGCAALIPVGMQVGTDLAERYLYQKYLQDKKLNDPAIIQR